MSHGVRESKWCRTCICWSGCAISVVIPLLGLASTSGKLYFGAEMSYVTSSAYLFHCKRRCTGSDRSLE